MSKRILIIGASGGIGSVVAEYFLGKGWDVIGSNFEDKLKDSLLGNGRFTALNFNVVDGEQLEDLASVIGEVDVIFNSSGVVDFESYNEHSTNVDIWRRTIDINLTGAYLVFEYLASNIKKGGSYIMMSSTDGSYGGKVNRSYAVSKAGVNVLTKSLALLVKDSGVRVNAIAAGWVETAMMEAGGDELVEYAKSINPLKRNGTPQDVAGLVEFLSSDSASYINGQIINLDGGYTLQDPTLVFEEQQIEEKR